MKKQIVLASTSPFRKTLLKRLELPFKTTAPRVNEDDLKSKFKGADENLCAFLAQKKALSLKEDFKNALIIGSDQSLFCEDKILGKGHNFKGACEQLKFCSGKTTKLITSVYVHDTDGADHHFESVTTLYFKKLSEDSITKYLKWDEPYNCAGSFKFESKGSFLFEKIDCSDPSAIEGLPMMELTRLLVNKGVVLNFI
jgi:MAF protein